MFLGVTMWGAFLSTSSSVTTRYWLWAVNGFGEPRLGGANGMWRGIRGRTCLPGIAPRVMDLPGVDADSSRCGSQAVERHRMEH
jgi:hypothetical protein